MVKLAESSGTVLCEDGHLLYICRRPATWTPVFLFVSGLLAFILLANGVLQLLVFTKDGTGSTTAGITLLLTGLLFTVVFWRVWLFQKKNRALPLHALKTTAIIDLENKHLLNGQRTVISSLNQVYLTRNLQITSSSPELQLRWQSGSLSIVKGSPFSGGIAEIEKVLRSKGIPKK
jgi:hypothetical protein